MLNLEQYFCFPLKKHLSSLLIQLNVTIVTVQDNVNVRPKNSFSRSKNNEFLDIKKHSKFTSQTKMLFLFFGYVSIDIVYSCLSGSVYGLYLSNTHVLYFLLVSIMSMYYN